MGKIDGTDTRGDEKPKPAGVAGYGFMDVAGHSIVAEEWLTLQLVKKGYWQIIQLTGSCIAGEKS